MGARIDGDRMRIVTHVLPIDCHEPRLADIEHREIPALGRDVEQAKPGVDVWAAAARRRNDPVRAADVDAGDDVVSFAGDECTLAVRVEAKPVRAVAAGERNLRRDRGGGPRSRALGTQRWKQAR